MPARFLLPPFGTAKTSNYELPQANGSSHYPSNFLLNSVDYVLQNKTPFCAAELPNSFTNLAVETSQIARICRICPSGRSAPRAKTMKARNLGCSSTSCVKLMLISTLQVMLPAARIGPSYHDGRSTRNRNQQVLCQARDRLPRCIDVSLSCIWP